MITYKCKHCGATLEINEGMTVAECDYCGTRQTLPRLDDERRRGMYDRANHFRRINEFDKAMGIFEQILQEDRTDAEAYWSLVLCRYGVTYVKDPVTEKQIPTVNRMQIESVLLDEDYKSALEYADPVQKELYETEAKRLSDIQREYLNLSGKEQPFDIFICYKESDEDGRRTRDSLLAQEVYYALTNEGYKVFFSRITLEDKVGQEYEPYIFAALNSAKVMLVIGTKRQYFDSPWVKNEWSRYLVMMKKDRTKQLFPCYRDMSPYDLPDEISMLQAQDMGSIGFIQDLTRNLKKVLDTKPAPVAPENTKPTNNISSSAEKLMKRVRLYLEDGEFDQAEKHIDRILDEDAEYAPVYIAKIMCEFKLRNEDELGKTKKEYESVPDWAKALRFADEEQKARYLAYLESTRKFREDARKGELFDSACSQLDRATTKEACEFAKAKFITLPGFRNSEEMVQKCEEKGEFLRKEQIYQNAKQFLEHTKDIEYISRAADLFATIQDYRDSRELFDKCYRIQQKKKRAKRVRRTIRTIFLVIIGLFILLAIIGSKH